MVCFHGYGENATLYGFLEKYLDDQFALYAIDLPFHGHTEWNEGLVVSDDDLRQIVERVMADAHSAPTGERFSLLGFSLGGRVVLSLYQQVPQAIDRIILMAPDGLKVNFWYWLSTQTWLGNKVFAYSMRNPGWFFAFLKTLNKLGWVNASIFKFVNYYIGNTEAREYLYQRWTGLRKLKPRLSSIKKMIRQYQTPVQLVYGKYDRIILPVRGKKFRKGIEAHCTLTVINSGHQVVHENHIDQLLPVLLQ
jgi:pimeloyl-ACP methyl ester carboxylesterase